MTSLKKSLNPNDFELWLLYQQQEQQGLKLAAKASLESFIRNLHGYSNDKLDIIVLKLCELRESEDTVIRHNLFEEVLCPNLVTNALANKFDYYRILATFEYCLNSSDKLKTRIIEQFNLETTYIDAIHLLESELKNNVNEKAALHLLNKLGQQLSYALHELPLGLLYEEKDIEKICNRISELINQYPVDTYIWQQRLHYIRTTIIEWESFNRQKNHVNFFDYLRNVPTANSSLILEWSQPLYDVE